MGSIISFLALFLGVILFSFVLWRQLKEDYTHDQVFYFTLLLLLGSLLGWFVTGKFFADYSFWGFLVGILIFGIYGIKKIGLKLFELIDSVSQGLFWLLFTFGVVGLVKAKPALEDIFFFLPLCFSLLAFHYFSRNYRRFSWYPSGKIGFVGFASLAVFFFVRFLIAFYFFFLVQSISNMANLVLNMVAAGVCFLTIYLRSGRKGAEKLLSIFVSKG